MDAITNLFIRTLLEVWVTFTHNWPFLLVSIIIAAGLKLYLDPEKVGAFLIRHQRAGVVGATAAAVGTPLCSCGTTAVILGMMASMIPWAPIIAFMVASPLTSPEELIYSAGLFGWPFALAFFISSILLGLFGGLLAGILESRGWFKGQARYAAPATCACETEPKRPQALSNLRQPTGRRSRPAVSMQMQAAPLALALEPCGCESSLVGSSSTTSAVSAPISRSAATPAVSQVSSTKHVTPERFAREAFQTGKRLLPMFFGFAFVGYFLNNLIPAAWVAAIFGQGNVYSIPLAAILGLPLYINTEASLPLVRALIDGGMSQGAALAFLITGAGTSFGAVAGALTIARWRVVGIVVGTLLVGAIILGYAYNLLMVIS